MYGFEFHNAGLFTKYLNCVRILSDEAPMAIQKDRLYFCLMDPSHVSMITMTIPLRRGISELWKEDPEYGEIVTVEFNEIWSLLKDADRERLYLKCEDGKATWTLTIQEGNIDVEREITTRIPDPLTDDVPEAKMPYNNEVVISSKRLLRELSEFPEYSHTAIWIEEEALVLYTEGDEMVKKTTIQTRAGESGGVIICKNDDNAVATYTTQYLYDYVEALSEVFDEITLGWSEENVLHIKGKADELSIDYCIAPCIGGVLPGLVEKK